jgi:hypothetical protein
MISFGSRSDFILPRATLHINKNVLMRDYYVVDKAIKDMKTA